MSRISVFVKIRPMLGHQANQDPLSQRVKLNLKSNQLSVELSQKRQKIFKFDGIIPQQCTQQEVYDHIQMEKLVNRVVEGYHSTIFAYGQTGSGKTFTIQGPNKSQQMGLIPRSIKNLFKSINERQNTGYTYKVYLSFLQIYNEQIFDLIDVSKKPLKMRWNKYQQFIVQNLFQGHCRTQQQALRWWKQGQRCKIIDSHNMNSQSSRSHCILTLRVKSYQLEDPSNNVQSKLQIVDLAGSQRQKVTKSTGIVFREGIEINKSLFALRQVISSLYESNIGSKQSALPPYRDSKLTSLLKQSIGGNAYCAMIACLNPTIAHFQQTIQTLTYASMASYISNIPSKNIDPKIKQNELLKQQNYNLKEENKKLSQHISYLTNLLQKNTCSKCGSINTVDLSEIDQKISSITKVNYYKKNSQVSTSQQMSNADVKLPKFNVNENRMARLSRKILSNDISCISNNDTQTRYYKKQTRQDRSFTIQPSISPNLQNTPQNNTSMNIQKQLTNPKQVLQSITMIKDLINANTKLRNKIQYMRQQADKMQKQTYQIIQQNQLLRERWQMLGSNIRMETHAMQEQNQSPISLYQRLIKQQKGEGLVLSSTINNFNNSPIKNEKKKSHSLNKQSHTQSAIINEPLINQTQHRTYNQMLKINSHKNKNSQGKILINRKKRNTSNLNKRIDYSFVF